MRKYAITNDWGLSQLIKENIISKVYAEKLRKMLDSRDNELYELASLQITELYFRPKVKNNDR